VQGQVALTTGKWKHNQQPGTSEHRLSQLFLL